MNKKTIKLMTLLILSCQLAGAKTYPGLEQLIGHCWQAKFPDGKKVDTHCFSEVYKGAFIKDQHVVCGEGAPYYGETWYANKDNQVSYRYYNSMGGVSDGTVKFVGGVLRFPDETYENAGEKITYRTTWTLQENSYQSNMWQQDPTQESGWKKIWKMDFKKINMADQNTVQFNEKQQLYCLTAD